MLPDVLTRIRSAERDANRREGSVQLLAVTKQQSPDSIQRYILSHGHFPLAEGRAQDLRDKMQVLPHAEWHFVGPFQRNKIKYFQNVTLIHSLESLWQAEAIAQYAEQWGQAPDVLLQVHNGEKQKHGFIPTEISTSLHSIRQTGLTVRGLMIMAPYEQPQQAATLFQETALRAHDLGLHELSMGMSNDFPLAIAAGSTIVRIGRSLFQ